MFEPFLFAVAFIIAFAVYLLLSRWWSFTMLSTDERTVTKPAQRHTDDDSTVATTAHMIGAQHRRPTPTMQIHP